MRGRLALMLTLSLLPLAACGADTSGIPCTTKADCPGGDYCAQGQCRAGSPEAGAADAGMLGQDLPASCPKPSGTDLYVDPRVSQGGNGSMACPFRTIAAATTTVPAPSTGGSTYTIHLARGTYSVLTNGESFPVHVAANVVLQGDTTATSRDAIRIDGSGVFTYRGGASMARVTVHLVGGLDYVYLTDVSGKADAIVLVTSSGSAGTSIATSTIAAAGCKNGIEIDMTDGARLSLTNQTDVGGAAENGLWIAASGGSPIVNATDSSFHDNKNDGVFAEKGTALVFGTMPACASACSSATACVTPGSCMACSALPPGAGPDSFYCNGHFGIEADVPVSAEGDHWNADVPTCGSSPADVNGCNVDDECFLGKAGTC